LRPCTGDFCAVFTDDAFVEAVDAREIDAEFVAGQRDFVGGDRGPLVEAVENSLELARRCLGQGQHHPEFDRARTQGPLPGTFRAGGRGLSGAGQGQQKREQDAERKL